MTVEHDRASRPNDEVDEIRWVSLAEFDRLGSFPSDRSVVHSFDSSRTRPGPTAEARMLADRAELRGRSPLVHLIAAGSFRTAAYGSHLSGPLPGTSRSDEK